MFKRIRKENKIAKLEARIKELEAERNDYMVKYSKEAIRKSELLLENIELQKEKRIAEKRLSKTLECSKMLKDEYERAEANVDFYMEESQYWQDCFERLTDSMCDYVEKHHVAGDIIDITDAIINKAFKPEEMAIDTECTVVDEVLLLMAPVEEEVVERVEAEVYYVKEINVDFRPYLFDIEDAIDLEEVVSESNEVEYHVAMNVGLDRVGEVDEIIFLRELETEEEANEMSDVSEVDAMKARNEERIKKALRKLKKSRGKVKVSERRTPPLPPHKRKVC